MSDAEAGIARIQVSANQNDKLEARQQNSIHYLNERIMVMVSVIALIGLIGLWVTATSSLILYGSLTGIIGLVIFIGVLKIKRLESTKQESAKQADNWNSDKP
jgi:hypothetical protein